MIKMNLLFTRIRFQSFDTLRLLMKCFQIPSKNIHMKKKFKIEGEELIRISIMRLHYPLRWTDLYTYFPGRILLVY